MRGGRGRPGLLLALCAAAALAACSTGGSEVVNSSSVSAVTSGTATTASSLTAAPPPSSATSTLSSVLSVSSVSPTSTTPAAPSTATAAAPPAAPATDATTEAGPGTTDATGFTSSIAGIDDALAARMGSSWRPGCPVPLADLRYLTVTHRGFDGSDHSGELVVAASVAPDVVQVFHRLYDNGFPLASLRLVDDFGGSDDQSMDADNSSAFNCRAVTGGGGFSEHSYGTAIDLNPVENPYLSGDTVLPAQGRQFLDRAPGPGVITAGDPVVAAFASIGWTWGGTWSGPVDYQHFSASGH
jgi:hypothetical protein